MLIFSINLSGFSASIIRAVAFVFFMLSMLIISQFLSFTYTYIADDFEFIITKNTKNISKTVCRLKYTDIIAIEKTKDFRKNKQHEYDAIYNYCPSLFSNDSYTVLYSIGHRNEIVLIEPDNIFLNILKKYATNDIVLP